MKSFHFRFGNRPQSLLKRRKLKAPLRHWQKARSWARLIKEAESLWRVDEKEIKRLGAIELGQLLKEVPPSCRRRVNLWLIKYSVATRFGRE